MTDPTSTPVPAPPRRYTPPPLPTSDPDVEDALALLALVAVGAALVWVVLALTPYYQ